MRSEVIHQPSVDSGRALEHARRNEERASVLDVRVRAGDEHGVARYRQQGAADDERSADLVPVRGEGAADHAQEAEDVGRDGEELGDYALVAEALDDGWEEEGVGVDSGRKGRLVAAFVILRAGMKRNGRGDKVLRYEDQEEVEAVEAGVYVEDGHAELRTLV